MKKNTTKYIDDIQHKLESIKWLRYKQVVRHINVFKLALKGFKEDRIKIRAAALTYFSVLSTVPLVAMMFLIARGLKMEELLQEKLKENLTGQEEVYNFLIQFTDDYLSNLSGGWLAGIGGVVLFWSVIKLLGNIETAFNHIWQIKKNRVMSRKISDYISLVVIAPVLIIFSSSLTIFLQEQAKISVDTFPLVSYLGSFLGFLVSLLPYVLMWMVFTLLYIIMPNTKVQFKAAIIGGILAGSMFQALQIGYVQFQSTLTSYNTIYGSFAALPLFFIWMQTSWLIVLFGAEVSFAKQNIDHYEAESESIDISNHLKRAVSLLIAQKIFIRFKQGLPPLTSEEISESLNIPVRLVRDIVFEMLETNILSETVTEHLKENAYQPAKDVNSFSIGNILDILDKRGNDKISDMSTKELDVMINTIDSFQSLINESKENVLLIDMEAK